MNQQCKNIPKKFVLLNNISLHILILFIILSSLFVFYISKIESDAINDEITGYINKFDLKQIDPKYKTYITDYITEMIKTDKNNEYENFIQNIGDNCTLTDSFPCKPCIDKSECVLSTCKDGTRCDPLTTSQRTGINWALGINVKKSIIDEITKLKDPNDKSVKDLLSKLNIENTIFKDSYFDYIINELQQNKDRLTEEMNRKVLEEIAIVIGFLILIALILNIVPTKLFKYCNNTLLGIVGELVCVFGLIGIIEVWFFKNVATKFVPTKPSLIVQTFKDKLISVMK